MAVPSTQQRPGLLLLLLAGPGTRESRSRTLEALRLAQTVASVGDARMRLLLVGEAVQWLRETMGSKLLEGGPAIAGSDKTPPGRPSGAPAGYPSRDPGPDELEELHAVHEEFLETLQVLEGLGVPVTACSVSVAERGPEGRRLELNVPRVACPRQVDRALERGWRLLSF